MEKHVWQNMAVSAIIIEINDMKTTQRRLSAASYREEKRIYNDGRMAYMAYLAGDGA
jgi:hypothetical protein